MRMKELRLRKHMSLQAVARELGIGYTAVFNWENRNARPTQENYDKIIKFYGEVPDDLELGFRGAPIR